jgi:hypothetical protein
MTRSVAPHVLDRLGEIRALAWLALAWLALAWLAQPADASGR